VDLARAERRLASVQPTYLDGVNFVRAYNTDVVAKLGHEHFFDCTWSFERGYRYNFARTHPMLYLAADHTVASAEIGPRTLADVLGPHLKAAVPPLLYVTVSVTARALDLTDPGVRRRLGVTLGELLVSTEDWDRGMKAGIWSATHYIGRWALQDGRFDGIVYPPYPWRRILDKPGKHNMAVFMDPSSPAMSRPRNPDVELSVRDPHEVLTKLGLVL